MSFRSPAHGDDAVSIVNDLVKYCQPLLIEALELGLPRLDPALERAQSAAAGRWDGENGKDSGYHRQARVDNAFFRYTSIIGESLRARSRARQETEVILACNILKQMTSWVGRRRTLSEGDGSAGRGVRGQCSTHATTPLDALRSATS